MAKESRKRKRGSGDGVRKCLKVQYTSKPMRTGTARPRGAKLSSVGVACRSETHTQSTSLLAAHWYRGSSQRGGLGVAAPGGGPGSGRVEDRDDLGTSSTTLLVLGVLPTTALVLRADGLGTLRAVSGTGPRSTKLTPRPDGRAGCGDGIIVTSPWYCSESASMEATWPTEFRYGFAVSPG